MKTIDLDPVWQELRQEAEQAAHQEPVLSDLFHTCLLDRASLEEALSYRLARKLGHHAVSEKYLNKVFMDAFNRNTAIGKEVRNDLVAVRTRDPACNDYLTPFMYFKGFQALTTYRIAHNMWINNHHHLALYLQSLMSEVFQTDIHPAAKIGSGILLDHATSFVVGETAVIEDNVSILHEVTLGGTGKAHGDRHPKIRSGVLISAGAKLLGNIEIGEGAKIGASSVVLDDVPAHCTAVGIPAKVICKTDDPDPALHMDHKIR